MTNPPSSNNKFFGWLEAEKIIRDEIIWLRNKIETYMADEKNAPITCKECLLRNIAVLVASGKVTATEIKKDVNLKSFWLENNLGNGKIKVSHGSDWHRETIEKIENHFLFQGFDVVREPNLHQGRADLGIYKNGEQDLYIEVGTTSLFKLWRNLEKMKNIIYLIVPNDINLIEFICN